jgi:ATP-binding cassette subfamily F protein 3
MLSRANLLVLDEPTNHLDVESIETLEDAIERYDGTVLLVSHDRELLRALTTKLWVLHDRHITEFAGGFAEWESVSAEREHAAAVRAAEEASLRKVHERKRVAAREADQPPSPKDQRRRQRDVQRAIEEQEATISALEARTAEITAALEDPELYTRNGGVEQAKQLGIELERLKTKLETSFARWTRLTEELESQSV